MPYCQQCRPLICKGYCNRFLIPMPCWSPMAAPAIRLVRRLWASAMKASTNTIGERVRGELHIQTVNSRHERLKGFLRRHRGIATKYLDSYLRWFHLAVLPKRPTPRAVLAAAVGLLPSGQCA